MTPSDAIPQETSPPATEPIDRLLRDLGTRRDGLSASEVERRRVVYGPNELARRGGPRWPRQLARQLVQPFALLLWVAAGLSFVEGTTPLAVSIVTVILLNAIVAFVQERHAERAVEALGEFLPATARVLRGGHPVTVPARDLVPGDVVLIDEGTRVSADARLLRGTVEIDMSSLSGESVPVIRAAHLTDVDVPLQQARDIVFSGTACVGAGGRWTGGVPAAAPRCVSDRSAASRRDAPPGIVSLPRLGSGRGLPLAPAQDRDMVAALLRAAAARLTIDVSHG